MIPSQPRSTKLSDPMRKVLENLINGLAADNHLVGKSQQGGFVATAHALIERGWMTWDHKITPLGRAAMSEK
jgi:hypothetical protein